MSLDGRARARQSTLKRIGLIAGVLLILALLFLVTGHWVLGLILAVAAGAGIWVFLQARSVR